MIIIKPLSCDNVADLIGVVSETYEKRNKAKFEFESMHFIAKYDVAKEIIYELIQCGYHLAFANEFSAPEWDNYDGEFIISLSCDEIWVEPIRRKDGEYCAVEGLAIFVMDDCSSKVIPHLQSELIYEVHIGEECDEDCENCDCCENEKESISYKVNGKPVDKKTFVDAINKIDDDYTDNIQNMLLKYCELQDEMNKWRKLAYFL